MGTITPTVKTENLCKNFGKAAALGGVSVTMAEQSITGLVGRNGSGKTTLMKILAGLSDPSGGTVCVFGARPADNLPVLRRVVYTYHNVAYDPHWRLQNILFAYETMYPRFDAAFAGRLMHYFELRGRMRYRHLSQGMASIFNFLCALACRADLTMLDEPVLGMDVTVRKAAYDILLREYTEHPRTFVVSSHLLSEIEGLLSDLILLERGVVVLHGGMDDIRAGAYRVAGPAEAVARYAEGRDVLARRTSELGSYAVIRGKPERPGNLVVSAVTAEELCVLLTRGQGKEEELACLW